MWSHQITNSLPSLSNSHIFQRSLKTVWIFQGCHFSISFDLLLGYFCHQILFKTKQIYARSVITLKAGLYILQWMFQRSAKKYKQISAKFWWRECQESGAEIDAFEGIAQESKCFSKNTNTFALNTIDSNCSNYLIAYTKLQNHAGDQKLFAQSTPVNVCPLEENNIKSIRYKRMKKLAPNQPGNQVGMYLDILGKYL